jgi:hypothetical protein
MLHATISAAQINKVQLMLLALEGVLLCVVSTVWMWVLLRKVAAQRYSLFSVFMVGWGVQGNALMEFPAYTASQLEHPQQILNQGSDRLQTWQQGARRSSEACLSL